MGLDFWGPLATKLILCKSHSPAGTGTDDGDNAGDRAMDMADQHCSGNNDAGQCLSRPMLLASLRYEAGCSGKPRLPATSHALRACNTTRRASTTYRACW